MGVKNIYGLERTGYVVGSLVVTNEDEIIVITKNGMSIRIPAADIRPTGRVTKGVKVVELRDDDTVASLAVVVDQAEV
jgi:DNA gyrase subunit A